MAEQAIEQLRQALEATNARLTAVITEKTQLQTEVAALQAAAATAPTGAPTGAGPAAPRRVIDTRVLGRPEPFSGKDHEWRDWATVFRSYSVLVEPNLAQIMHDAEASRVPALNTSLTAEHAHASNVLYHMLLMLCRGPCIDIIANAGANEGAEAWRLLTERYDPRQQSRIAGSLMEILRYNFAGDPCERVETWERKVTAWEARSGEKMSDTLRIGVATLLLEDGPIKQHLLMNAERLKTWLVFRQELVEIRRAQVAAGVAPMDVGALTSKGGGKTQKPRCEKCGRIGHLAKDCWAKGGKKGGGRGSSSDGGKAGSSSSAAGSRDKSQIVCHKCGKKGHYKSECRSKGVHSMEEENDNEDGAAQEGADEPELEAQGLFLACLECFPLEESLEEGETARLDAQLCAFERSMETTTFGIDSCAAVSIIKTDVAADYPMDPGFQPNTYLTANGSKLQDEGRRSIFVKSQEGQTRGIRARVGRVSKNLLAMADLVDTGHRVIFDSDGSYAVHKQTKKRLNFTRRRNVFEADFEVLPFSMAPKGQRHPG